MNPINKPPHLKRSFFLALCLSTGLASIASHASQTFPDALASDPKKLGWMLGSPPPADKILRFEDGSYFEFPAMRWSVSNFRQLMPTRGISRGSEPALHFSEQFDPQIDNLTFTPIGSNQSMRWDEALLANYTDGIAVLHRGNLVYERYFGVLNREGQHGAMSVTKTFIGTLAAILVAEGKLNEAQKVAFYVPELANSAFGTATIRQLMDMTTGIRFSEDYADPKAEVWSHAAAGNPLPKPAGYTGPRSYYEFLQTVRPEGQHGEAFHYRTANTDALGWVLARVTGKSVAELLSEHIWSQIGAERDAYISVDSIGTPFAGGGLNTSLRDLARFGEMIRNNGQVQGKQVIPLAAIEDIRKGGNKAAFAAGGYSSLPGWSYRSMWWITHNEHGALMARGVHGQTVYIDPEAEMVIARFASHPIAANAANDATSLPAWHRLAIYLKNKTKTQ